MESGLETIGVLGEPGLHASRRFGYAAGMTTRESKRRRWYQYRLRTLLVFVLLASIGLSWFGVKLNQARKQREAVGAIEEFGGGVERKGTAPNGLGWLQRVFGDDFFKSVVHVELSRPREFNRHVGDLTYLKGLTDLQGLDLTDTQVSDAGMEHLKGLTKLHILGLGGTQVSDAGLEHLKGLANLEVLSLGGTQVSDAGLEHLKGLTKLSALDLRSTKVRDAGLEQLKGLTNLRVLFLGGTQVIDAGMEYLKGLTGLVLLALDDTKVTDAGLEHLKGLSQLQELYLKNTSVTADAVKRFRQSHLNCRIEFASPTLHP